MKELEKIKIALAKEGVLFLLKEPVQPIDLHVAGKAPLNTLATETDKNYLLYHLTQPCLLPFATLPSN
jgi:hypothetical protein